MLLGLFMLAMLLAGFSGVAWLWDREMRAGRIVEPKSVLDTLTMTLVAALMLATAINWGLSAFRALSEWPLVGISCACTVVSIAWLARRRRAATPDHAPVAPRSAGRAAVATAVVVALLPLAIWIGFVTWRGYIMPPLNHDALSYHLPKAVFYARHRGFYHPDTPDWRFGLPADYELLLTDIFVLTHTDAVTEWLGVLSFIAYLGASGSLVQRWWGWGLHLVLACLVLASTPIALLSSGADKNDLLVAALTVCLLHWTARWAALGESVAATVSILAAAMLIGVKPNGLVFAAAAVPAVLLGARRRGRLSNAQRPLGSAFLIGAIAMCLLGGACYVDNLLPHATRFPPSPVTVGSAYGQWANLWMAPVLFFLAPFGSRALEVWVPWRHEYWFWPRYELFFSNWGIVVSLLVIAIPIVLVFRRGRGGGAGAGTAGTLERRAATVTGLLGFFLFLPVHMVPLGLFAGYPRYLLFMPALIVAAGVPPLWKTVLEWTRAPTASAILALVAASGWFCKTALEYGTNDRFVPIRAVEAAAASPSRRVPFQRRAPEIVDRLAGPHDLIAVEGGVDTWLQPLFGPDLTRPIVFLHASNGHLDVPDAAAWVVIDRCWDAHWTSPDFQNMGQWRRFLLGPGAVPSPGTEIYRMLLGDPRFRLIYEERSQNQAVFKRLRS